ncbi:MAG: glutamate--tRNA ligase [Candidatus Marinimicrobia bacterium]|nr:glutamate--tRNA ligase [Candidatus Neomarinimicrobiota bacterium]
MTVVTRFAPSPTGFVHVGSHRTALYNYIFARQQGGRFILRIEDTDQNRYVEGAVENLLSSLSRLGVSYDAGPGKEDAFGPYFQSERLSLYRREVEKLLASGHAYRCFCSAERLEAVRNEQLEQQVPTGYDGACRGLTREESDRRARDEAFVIRLKVPREGMCAFHDIVRGDVEIAWSQIDDQVLMKSDGFPTYHLANVVDDHYMEVTHIIRGEEWLPSVPKHLYLYESFGWKAPHMAHLPLLLNPDRSKLSKRQGDVAVEDYLKKGYLPDALNNFLALMGWNPGGKNEIYTLDELIAAFDINKITKSGAVFDVQKLNWMNGQYIKTLDTAEYLREARNWLGTASVNEARLDTALLAVKTSLLTLNEIPEKLAVFIGDPAEPEPEAAEMLALDSSQTALEAYAELLADLPGLTAEGFKDVMSAVQTRTGIKGKMLWMPVRIALTGMMHGPELGYIAEYLGKEENIRRVLDRIEGRQDNRIN